MPLHSWLPDAHSQAPAPVSALMSGVLLPVAVYALARYRVIAVASVDPGFVRGLLLAVALVSLLLAAGLLLAQRDYKRLLAYSSIEHMAPGGRSGSRSARRWRSRRCCCTSSGTVSARQCCSAAPGEILAREGTTRIDRRPRAVRPGTGAGRSVRGRAGRAARPAAVQPVRQRARPAPSRHRRRTGLGGRRRTGACCSSSSSPSPPRLRASCSERRTGRNDRRAALASVHRGTAGRRALISVACLGSPTGRSARCCAPPA